MVLKELYQLYLKSGQKFTTDSRAIEVGSIFFALKGERFDGNKYADAAIEQGSSFVVVDDGTVVRDDRYILVDDVLATMQELAQYHRRQFTIPIIAIGGSNGKTTTKELLKSVFEVGSKVHATKGNFNNLIGVPITLLEMPLDTDFGVIEIGTNTFGEIEKLCTMVEPNYGIITNIGKEHLEGFGDIEGVTREESELYHYLKKQDGFAFVNADDPILLNMSRRLSKKQSFAINNEAELEGTLLQSFPEIILRVDEIEITSSLCGSYNAENILAVYAMAKHFGISSAQIIEGIAQYKSSNNRSEYLEIGSNKIILDAYNANPSSVAKALNSFREVESVNKYLFLGDMLEMGDYSEIEHRAIIDLAAEMPNCKALFVGTHFAKAAEGTSAMCFDEMDNLADYMESQKIENAWLLIKGSRGIRMEKVLDLL